MSYEKTLVRADSSTLDTEVKDVVSEDSLHNSGSECTTPEIAYSPCRTLYVDIVGRRTIRLSVHSSATGKNIKRMIEVVLDSPSSPKSLEFGGKELQDNRSLADHRIGHEATLKAIIGESSQPKKSEYVTHKEVKSTRRKAVGQNYVPPVPKIPDVHLRQGKTHEATKTRSLSFAEAAAAREAHAEASLNETFEEYTQRVFQRKPTEKAPTNSGEADKRRATYTSYRIKHNVVSAPTQYFPPFSPIPPSPGIADDLLPAPLRPRKEIHKEHENFAPAAPVPRKALPVTIDTSPSKATRRKPYRRSASQKSPDSGWNTTTDLVLSSPRDDDQKDLQKDNQRDDQNNDQKDDQKDNQEDDQKDVYCFAGNFPLPPTRRYLREDAYTVAESVLGPFMEAPTAQAIFDLQGARMSSAEWFGVRDALEKSLKARHDLAHLGRILESSGIKADPGQCNRSKEGSQTE